MRRILLLALILTGASFSLFPQDQFSLQGEPALQTRPHPKIVNTGFLIDYPTG
jgi:hypothetical protein